MRDVRMSIDGRIDASKNSRDRFPIETTLKKEIDVASLSKLLSYFDDGFLANLHQHSIESTQQKIQRRSHLLLAPVDPRQQLLKVILQTSRGNRHRIETAQLQQRVRDFR